LEGLRWNGKNLGNELALLRHLDPNFPINHARSTCEIFRKWIEETEIKIKTLEAARTLEPKS